MRFFKRCLSAALSVGIVFSAASFDAYAIDEDDTDIEESKGVVILHTNDVHCDISSGLSSLGYAELAGYRARMEEQGYTTILVDSGDFFQGADIGTFTAGESIVDIMNEVGYDVVTPGEHDFDYGLETFNNLSNYLNCEVISSNFLDDADQPVCKGGSYYMCMADDISIAFVGVSNPNTITDTNPAYFQDENGEYAYNFCEGNDGADLYNNVQASVDEAKAEGAEFVVVLSHLGNGDGVLSSNSLIANTNGIDVVLDGHAHNVVKGKKVKNKDGQDVVLSSGGSKMTNINKIELKKSAEPESVLTFSTSSILKSGYTVTTDTESDEYYAYESVLDTVNTAKSDLQDNMDTIIANSETDLITKGSATGSPTIRTSETNLGDLCADAYRESLGADIAILDAASLFSGIPAGDITFGQIAKMLPSGNTLSVISATGQEIIDALEFGAASNPKASDRFLQVSGLTCEIHNYIDSSVKVNEAKQFVSVDGEYRVKNVMINDDLIDPEAIYTVASYTELLKGTSTEYTMFADNPIVKNAEDIDNQALLSYVSSSLGGYVGEDYINLYGNGRIAVYSKDDLCGENEIWSFDSETGTLTIKGSGDMYQYKKDNQPWKKYKDDILTVVQKGEANINPTGFIGCENLGTVILGEDEYIVGDISQNGDIDILDAITIAKYLIHQVELTDNEKVIADFDHKGTVDILDATGIAKKLLEKNKK